MINTLLDVERMESGNMEMNKEVAEISTIVSQAVNSVGYLAEKSGIKIVSEFEPIEAFADAGSLVQVMVNLLANAIKFSPSGSTITISALETPHFIEVRVSDQGRGIPKDALPSVFDRFKQVEASDRTEKGGSGLGLAICKSIIEAHGGIIGVESAEGKGTTFWWRLPVEV
jgi:two-component system, OmpR family, sensor histidine kinase VicK